MEANAGLVINTPIEIPNIVVNGNPVNNPAPAQNNGIMLATPVNQATIITKNAFFILSLKLPDNSFLLVDISSAITI